MTDYECYCEYIALKLHFTSSTYDYHKYAGQTGSTTVKAFEKRRDKHFFNVLSKEDDPSGMILANAIKNPKLWIRDITSREGQKVYEDWNKRRQALTYNYKEEIKTLNSDFNKNFVTTGQHPLIIRFYLAKKISLETFAMILDLVKCQDYFDKNMPNDLIWGDLKFLATKYLPFINFNREDIKKITRETFNG